MALQSFRKRRPAERGFTPLKTGDREVDRNFQGLAAEVESLRTFLSDAVLIEDIVPSGATATLSLSHAMGRDYRGWMVVRNTGSFALTEDTSNNLRDRLLVLNYSGAATNKLSIVVF